MGEQLKSLGKRESWKVPCVVVNSNHRLKDLSRLLMARPNVILALCDVAPTTDSDELCELILGLYEAHDRTAALLERIIWYECHKVDQYSEIFRNNNLLTKMMRVRMQKIGKPYLLQVIGPIISEIIQSGESYEVDPARLEDPSQIASNENRLVEISRKLLSSVLESHASFPVELKTILDMLHNYAHEAFPKEADMGLTCGFFFLRFISPFIIAPGAYGFVSGGSPSKQATRGLILLSKTVQNVANDVQFGSKESFMLPLNKVVMEFAVPVQKFVEQMIQSRPASFEYDLSKHPAPSREKEDTYLPELHIYLSANRLKMYKILSQRYDGGDLIEESEMKTKIKSRAAGYSVSANPSSDSANHSPTAPSSGASIVSASEGFDSPQVSDVHMLAQVLIDLGPPAAPVAVAGVNTKEKVYSEDLNDNSETKVEKNKIFQNIFHLQTSDEIIAEYSCSLDGQIPVAGRLYLSENYLCFYASVFGFVTKEIMPLWTVSSIDKEPSLSNSIEITVGHQTYVLLGLEKVHKTYDAIRQQWKLRKSHSALPGGAGSDTSTLTHLVTSSVTSTEKDKEKEKGLLTAKDWQLFQQGARQVTYMKNQCILKQGQKSTALYQIARGDVRVEKNSVLEYKLHAGDMFGEISFLQAEEDPDMALAQNSFMADGEVDMYIIDHQSIAALIKKDPNLAARFYKWLAIILGRKMRKSSAPSSSNGATTGTTASVSTPTVPRKDVVASHIVESRISDSKFHKLFDITDSKQVLLHQYYASMQKTISVHGCIYVSIGYVGFHAKVLGVSVREVQSFQSIDAIIQEGKTIEIQVAESTTKKQSSEDANTVPKKTIAISFTSEAAAKQVANEITGYWRACKKEALSRPRQKSGSANILHSVISPRERISSNAFPVVGAAGGEEPKDTLTESDLKLFLQVAQQKKFKKDDVVLAQGQAHNNLFQIAKGSVRVELNNKPIGRVMRENEFFGEMAYLEGGVASASCVCDSEGTEVYIIDGEVVNRLLAAQPGLAGRLYKVLASILADRIKK